MYSRRFFAIAIVLLLAVALAWAADPPTWGFIDADITCKTPGGKSFRVKLLSQIFSYCGLDITDGQILNGNKMEIDQGARSACQGGTPQITYSAVHFDLNKDAVSKHYDQEMSNPQYEKHEKFTCSCAYPMSSKCRSSNY